MIRYFLVLLLCFCKNFAQSQDDIKAALLVHNKARNEVGIGSLIWSEELADDAQQYAIFLAENNKFEHSLAKGFGENLFWGRGFSDKFLLKAAAEAWYREKSYYQYGPILINDHFYKIGHYTQMIWQKTQKVGIGMARASNGEVYVVARYYPPGNFIGQYPY